MSDQRAERADNAGSLADDDGDPTLAIVRKMVAESTEPADLRDAPPPDLEPEARTKPRTPWRPWSLFLTPRRDGRRKLRWGRIGVLLLAAAVFLAPWVVLATLVLILVLLAVVYLTLGHDRVCELAVGAYDWLARRHPAKAAGMRRRWRRLVGRWGARLPGELGDRFTPAPVSDETQARLASDPFGRLAGPPEQAR